jgi:hypothetical protein
VKASTGPSTPTSGCPAIHIVALDEDCPRLQEAALRAGAPAYLAKERLVLSKRLLRGELA